MTTTPDLAHLLASPLVKELSVAPQIRAIYFLVRQGKVIYVGQTTNLITVAARHKDKNFDQMFYLPAPKTVGDLDTIEMACIAYFWADLNVTGRHAGMTEAQRQRHAVTARTFLGLRTQEDYQATLATDVVLFGYQATQAALHVLLIRRGAEPYKGLCALPGGRVAPQESAEQAALRELQEEVNIQPSHLEQLYTFSAPQRDPRGRVLSVAYFGLVNMDHFVPQAGSDAADAFWCALPEALGQTLAFDHQEILRTALERLLGKIRYTPIGVGLLPSSFTIQDLRHLYEVLLERKLDASNFRKRILAMGVLAPASEPMRRGTHRPAPLYMFDYAKYKSLTKKGWNFEV